MVKGTIEYTIENFRTYLTLNRSMSAKLFFSSTIC